MYNELKEFTKNKIVVKNQQDLMLAGNFLVKCKELEDKIKNYWKDAKDKAYKAHKEIVSKEKEMLNIVNNKKDELVNAIIEYDNSITKVEAENGKISFVEKIDYEIEDEEAVKQYLIKNKLYECLNIDKKKLQDYLKLINKDVAGIKKIENKTIQIRRTK